MRIRTYVFVTALAAAGAYAAGASRGWLIAAAVTVPLAIAAAPGFLRGLRTPSARESPTTAMSGVEFEEYVAGIARQTGEPVIMTPVTGDWGVDLIVGKRPNRVAIQCKRLSRPVGPGAIQEVVAGAPMQDCAITMVVSNQPFTPAARQLAEQHGCELVGGDELSQLGRRIRRLTR